jgi:G3E family GTPase
LYDLNPDTPKIRTHKGFVSPEVIFGIDSQLFLLLNQHQCDDSHQEAKKDAEEMHQHHLSTVCIDTCCHPEHQEEVSVFHWTGELSGTFDRHKLLEFLNGLNNQFYRVKGFLKLSEDSIMQLVNFAFGRYNFFPVPKYVGNSVLTFMGDRLNETELREATLHRLNSCIISTKTTPSLAIGGSCSNNNYQ